MVYLIAFAIASSVFFELIAVVFERNLISISEQEIENLRFLYRTKHPERQLLFSVWIPFLDESESWYFEFLNLFELWAIVLLTEIFDPAIFVALSMSSVTLSICLYQLTLSSSLSLPTTTIIKYILEFLGSVCNYFYLCHCSDILDDCHAKLRQAITNSDWYRCSNRTKQDLCIFLRRLQRPNHLTFSQGFLILSREFFVKVFKASYSFVNFMQLMSMN
ncbi:hypothetical protein WDU94_008613 [Cyamophila willieti]